MPIYEYKCENCGHQFEKLQKMSDPPAITCPKCNKDSLKKMVSAAAFKLTGTGWYETDFKEKKSKTDNQTNSANNKSKTEESAKDSKSDTKKTEAKGKTDKKPTGSD